MKKTLALAVALLLVAAGVAIAGVAGTPHDLSGGTGEICVGCHTPHGGTSLAGANALIWNRSFTSSSYTAYTGSTFDMGPASVTKVQSVACLVCHDGGASTAINTPGPGAPANTTWDLPAGTITGQQNLGTDLSNDHPVGFTYNAGADLNGNNFPAVAAGAINATGASYPLYGGTFECATCHDVHNNAVTTQSPVYFLRYANTNSNMCADCHTTKK